MNDSAQLTETAEMIKHPLLVKINELCYRITKVKLAAVYPSPHGWEQVSPGGKAKMPSFCRLIHSVPEGAKHCSMCHVLMTVAACSTGSTTQKCHAGISVLVHPVNEDRNDQPEAVLSSCLFTSPERGEALKEAVARGKKLNIDIEALKQAFNELPVLSKKDLENTVSFMKIAADAIKEIRAGIALQAKVARAHKQIQMRSMAEAAVAQKLKAYGASKSVSGKKKPRKDKGTPAIINVVKDTVTRRPDFHFSVSDIAAAARMTPNHFSSLFHQHCGQTFSDFVTDVRMTKAKELLKDFTLNISEIASRVGFDDPGYFARRFRQIEGCSPRQWREEISLKAS